MTKKSELIRAVSNSKLPQAEIAKRLKRCSKVNPALDRILSSEDSTRVRAKAGSSNPVSFKEAINYGQN